MADKPDYRFKFEITDETTGEIIIADWLTLGAENIDQFGGCEAVDHAVARMLRMFRQSAREKFEREHYAMEDA